MKQRMRQLCAILLVGWLSASLTLPAWGNAGAKELPECCRRSGQHKCAMAEAIASDSSHPVIASLCPYAKLHQPEAVVPTTWLPVRSQIVFAELLSHPAARPQIEAHYRASLLRSRQKRGPPSFPSSELITN